MKSENTPDVLTADPATRSPGSDLPPAVRAIGISKRFGSTVAVDNAGFACGAGEIHALLGENGAGKSTLMKILSGMYRADSGAIELGGEEVRLRSSRDAIAAGVATAYQELTLESNMRVADNLLLSQEPTRRGFVSFRRVAKEAEEILAEWEAEDLDPRVEVGKLSLGARQRLEIVRALHRGSRVLVMDEPSSALTAEDVGWLFRQLRRAKEAGVGVIYISHRMGEVNEICDHATVLRNGRVVSDFEVGSVSDAEVVELMLGRGLAKQARRGAAESHVRTGEIALAVRGLAVEPELRGVDLEVSRGEILGVAGLEGHGQRALFRALFGAERAASGQILMEGDPVSLRSPRDAIKHGIGLIPEDRQEEGLLSGMSISSNVSLPTLGSLSTLGVIRGRRERSAVSAVLAPLRVTDKALDADAAELSGGNQQKLVLAKWLLARSRFLLLYDATRGVDVGTKAEMFDLMHGFAADGGTVMLYSTDVEELAVHADRVAVLYRGGVRATLGEAEIGEDRILAEMIGGGSDGAAA
jgi:ribose transport system ATP-binding protein